MDTPDLPCTGLPVSSWLLGGPAAAGGAAAIQGAAVGLMRSALQLLLITPEAAAGSQRHKTGVRVDSV